VTTSDATTSDSDTHVPAYEELRQRVLAGATHGSHFGLVVLLREGIAAWMQRAVVGSAGTPAAGPDRRPAAPVLPDEIQAGVVRVLANMALSGRGELSP
jgi:hypothetical protein